MGAEYVNEAHARKRQAGSYRLEIWFAQLPEHRDAERHRSRRHDTERDRAAGGVPCLEQNSHGEGCGTGDARCKEGAELNTEIAMPWRFGDT